MCRESLWTRHYDAAIVRTSRFWIPERERSTTVHRLAIRSPAATVSMCSFVGIAPQLRRGSKRAPAITIATAMPANSAKVGMGNLSLPQPLESDERGEYVQERDGREGHARQF